jgi:flagellar motor switch/type III secretory pathway protein FliN
MTPLDPTSQNEVLAACQASLDQAASAFQHVFQDEFRLSIGHSGKLDPSQLPPAMESAGLVMVLTVGQQALLLVLGEQGNLLPEWCQTPDDSQTHALAELAQTLGSLWLPPLAAIEDARAAYSPSLAEAILRGQPAPGAALISLTIANSADQRGDLLLIWPAANPAAVLNTSLPMPGATMPSSSQASAAAATPQAASRKLPSYAKSLLHIRVPVTVTLAAQKLPLGRIVELGPGSLLQFEKSCEELLELEVNGQRVAVGEAVKVGDKFGIRVSSMILPDERFVPIGRPQ